MPKNTTPAAQAEASKQYGTEPLVILNIEWSTGDEQYGDKSQIVGTFAVQGLLSSASPVSSVRKDGSSGEFSSIRITLSDKNNTLKDKVNCLLIEGTLATVYQYFEGLAQADLIVLLKGRIYGDVEWDEENRQLQFTVEQFVDEEEIGKSLDEDEIVDQAKDVAGVPWPYGFGTAVHVPALRIRKSPRGELAQTINESSITFDINNGTDFPQNTPVEILIGQVKYSGSFDGDEFTSTGANLPRYINLALAERPRGDVNVNDPKVLWLADEDVYIQGHYVWIDHTEFGDIVNFCVKQMGNKCIFRKPWTNDAVIIGSNLFSIFMDENETIEETAVVARDTWPVPYRWQYVAKAEVYGNPGVVNYAVPFDYAEVWQTIDIPQGKFVGNTGGRVKLVQQFDDMYVFNVIPSVQVLQVYGTRTFGNDEIFVPIPSSYYLKNLNNPLAGEQCSTLEFPITLEDRTSEQWSGDIYVSYISSVGPNVANIINHILTKYTNLTIDAITFNDVRLDVDPYPAHFAFFQQVDALSFIENVAYQSRCATIIRNGELVLKYLSEIPVTDATVMEEDIQLETLELEFKRIEEVTTRIDATYFLDYSGREEQEKIFTYRNNPDQFGTRQESVEWFIYTNLTLVQMSSAFWGNRLSNIWRQFEYNTFLENIELQVFDVVNHFVPDISLNNLRSELELQSQDTSNASLQLRGTLASKAGVCDGENQPIEDLTYWTGDPAYPIVPPGIIDPCPNCQESDDPVFVPGSSVPNPNPDPEPESNLQIVWTEVPEKVERGVPFVIRAEVRNSNGDVETIDFDGTLDLVSTDGGDVLTGIDMQFFAGQYQDVVTISGGGLTDSGTLTIFPNAANIDPAPSSPFIIWDGAGFSANCTSPANVTRGVAFAVQVALGAPGAVLDVNFTSLVNDKLYLAGTETEVTQVTLDGGGDFNPGAALLWEIRGGNTAASAVIGFVDSLNPPDTIVGSCGSINVTGASPQLITDLITFEDQTHADGNYCEVTISPVTIQDDTPFTLEVRIFKFDGTLDTTFNGFTTILAEDTGAGDDDLVWTQVCANTNNHGDFIIGTVVDGIWFCDALKLNLTLGIGPVNFTASTTVQDEPPIIVSCEAQSTIIAPSPSPSPSPVQSFSVACPANITRGVPFNITLQALDINLNELTTYIPTTQVDFSLASTDISDGILPIFTDNTGWLFGKKTVAMTISGGAGSDSGIINVQDASLPSMVGDCNLAIAAAGNTHNSIAFGRYDQTNTQFFALNSYDVPPAPDAAWDTVQAAAINAFLLDNSLDAIDDETRYLAVNLEDDSPAELSGIMGAHYAEFNITAAQRAGVVAVTLRIRMNLSDNLPTGPNTVLQYSVFGSSTDFKIYTAQTQDRVDGAAVDSAPFQSSFNGNDIINKLWAITGPVPAAPPFTYIELELPLSTITSMVTDNLFVWTYFDMLASIPLRPVTARPTTGARIGTGFEITPAAGTKAGCRFNARDAEIIIYK